MRKNYCFIIEGADRIGKTTAILSLIDTLRDDNYTVIPFFVKGEVNAWQPFDTTFDKFLKSNTNVVDIMAVSIIPMMWSFKKVFQLSETDDTKATIIIVDRLHISNYVFGSILRTESFETVWGESGATYLSLMSVFEKQMNQLCEASLITLVKSELSEDYYDDNEHPVVTISSHQQKLANSCFISMSELSELKHKETIELKQNSQGWYDTFDRVLTFVNKVIR